MPINEKSFLRSIVGGIKDVRLIPDITPQMNRLKSKAPAIKAGLKKTSSLLGAASPITLGIKAGVAVGKKMVGSAMKK